MKATEVFIPGGYPNHTLVEDHLVSKQQQLIDTLEMGTMLISISGPSKSGKTVFVKKVLGTQRLIEVTGAGVQSANDLWKRVFDILGVPVTQVQSKTGTSSFSSTGELSAQAGVILAKGSLKGSASAGIVQQIKPQNHLR